MISDFFYPQAGGIELHVYHLSQKLIDLGHSVVVLTHAYNDRTGIRYLTNGLKVYYIPFWVVYRQSAFPTVFSAFPILRNIFIREQIDIVHGHGSFSTLSLEAIFHATTMGTKTVFTDHSLFGFANVGSILGNKTLTFSLLDVGHVITVSHTCKENTVLRAKLDAGKVSVIPNAVVWEDFTPARRRKNKPLTIVVISRLFPNKGIDLLTAITPRICSLCEDIRFLIAGEGPKFIDLEQMREFYQLQDRVELIGSVKHEQVRDVMVQGDIYLHPSLTEAFGTVLVEAASCGLLVVTTDVGGIPEVLPSHMTVFAKPEEDSLVKAVLKGIDLIKSGQLDTFSFHQEVQQMYDWKDIARRTEIVYQSLTKPNTDVLDRLTNHYSKGEWAGKLFVLCVVVDIFLHAFLDFWFPRDKIDLARKWPKKLPRH